ncbi:egg cell-secreted protein 1.4-like [Papaver somniferum]|uniref:egg cell-secreted protein 1.4-like n=1 Tax=Papaver somniferum TaxID=3469 RepID=UPI000E6FB556|nr:egg cell-secreted protein 1.4-like [Papaver somniferum]
MASAYFTSSKFLFGLTMLIAVTLAAMRNTGTARPLVHVPEGSPISLAARLQSTGSYSECWDSLMELQACTGEVILFFLNGETHLGNNCCRAIHVIQHSCWPAMLGSLGFTQEEGDILRGYCDAAANVDDDVVRSPSPPSIVPIMKGE